MLSLPKNLAWDVEKAPLFDANGNEVATGTFRSDNKKYLGVVSDRYTVIQNSELLTLPNALSSLVKIGAEDIKGESFDFGRHVSIRVKLPLVVDVKQVGDITEMYLRIFAKHDGTGAVASQLEAKRLVCLNGMRVTSAARVASIRHTANALDMMEVARSEIKNIEAQVIDYQQKADFLAGVQLKSEDIGAALMEFYDEGEKNNLYTNERKQQQARQILGMFEINDNNAFPTFAGTAWALLNSFTRFATHNMLVRADEGEEAAARSKSLFFGRGADFSDRAYKAIAKVLVGRGLKM